MNDSKIKNKIYKINEKSLKKFDEIIMDSIIGLTIYNKADKDMLQRLTLAHISFFIESDFKKFETLSDEEKDLYCKILFDVQKWLKMGVDYLKKVVYFFVGKSPSKYCHYGANMIW